MEPAALQCRLLLGAVLPAAATAASLDDQARTAAGMLGCGIRFSSTSGVETVLRPDGPGWTWAAGPETHGRLHLRGSDAAWAALLAGRFWPPVLPAGGWLRLARLRHFSAWMDRTRTLLETTADGPGARPAAITQLTAAVGGAAVLLRAGTCTLPGGSWAATYQIGTDGPLLWIDATGTTGTGSPPAAPWVEMTFESPATALAAFHDRDDTLALANTGRIRIRGHLPLADALEVAMARAGAYLRGAPPAAP